MAFADPQSVTYDGTAHSLAKISSGVNSGVFQSLDGGMELDLSISHTYGKRTRRVVRLDMQSLQANPLVSGTNVFQSQSCSLVFNTPADFGIIDPATAVKHINALTKWLTDSSNANALSFAKGMS